MAACGKGKDATVKCLLKSDKVDANHINAQAQVMKRLQYIRPVSADMWF